MESHLSILLHQSGLLTSSKWRECTSLISPLGHLQDHLGWKHQLLMEHIGDLWKSYYRTMTPRCRAITWVDMHFLSWGRDLLLLFCFIISTSLDGCFIFQRAFKAAVWSIYYRMDYGEWTENSRGTYNKWDGIARSTTQVYILHYCALGLIWFLLKVKNLYNSTLSY